MTEFQHCDTAKDCIEGEVIKVCYENPDFANTTNICDCSNWYGWTGDDCNEISPQLIYMRTTCIILVVWTGILVVMLSTQLGKWISLYGLKYNPMVVTGCFSLLAAICIFCYASLQLPSLFNAYKFQLIESVDGSDEFDISTDNGNSVPIFLSLSLSFLYVACLSVSVSWLDTVDSTLKIFGKAEKSMIAIYKRMVTGIIIVYFIIVIVSIALKLIFIAAIVAPILCLLLLVFYLYGRIHFLNLLDFSAGSDTSAIAKVKSTVRWSSKVAVICLTGIGVSAIMHYIVYDTFDSKKPGTLNYVLMLRDLTILFGAGIVTHFSRYFKAVSSRLMAKKAPPRESISFYVEKKTGSV